jgi:hypothetical protein
VAPHGFRTELPLRDGSNRTTNTEQAVLDELGASEKPRVIAANKIDAAEMHPREIDPAALGVSAATLCCHPYDICTALIAREAGCVIEAPAGGALNYPLDTTTPVAWMGYANARLARLVRPALRRVMAVNF